MLRDMLTIRRMEVECDKLYKQAKIRGFLHLYDGQEAIAVGHDNGVTQEDAFIEEERNFARENTNGNNADLGGANLQPMQIGPSGGPS